MKDNYKKDLEVNKKIKKTIRRIWSIPITCTIVSFVGYLMVASIVQSTNGIPVHYKVRGVDKGWLSSHPLIDNAYPKKIKSTITLPSPKIDGHKFEGWYTNTISQDVQKDNEININDGMLHRLFTYQLDVYAKFTPTNYKIGLVLDNETTLNGMVNSSYDGHVYAQLPLTDIYTTTYICSDKVFSLPTASKPGKTFNPEGWKIKDTDTYITEVDPANCEDLTLVAEWL